jgi:hypothetical protein
MKRGKRKNAPRLDTVKKLAADIRRNEGLYSIRDLGLFLFFDQPLNLT